MRTSSTSAAWPFSGRSRRCRGAATAAATTSAPTLWRVPANSAPGLPRPTTSRSAGVPAARRVLACSPAPEEAAQGLLLGADSAAAASAGAGLALGGGLALFALLGRLDPRRLAGDHGDLVVEVGGDARRAGPGRPPGSTARW